jgi:hypothetical protein
MAITYMESVVIVYAMYIHPVEAMFRFAQPQEQVFIVVSSSALHVARLTLRVVSSSIFDHRRTAWGVQRGRRRPEAARPVGGSPLKQL